MTMTVIQARVNVGTKNITEGMVRNGSILNIFGSSSQWDFADGLDLG